MKDWIGKQERLKGKYEESAVRRNSLDGRKAAKKKKNVT